MSIRDNVENAALVVAAGRGTRAGRSAPKQYVRLAGAPVLRRTLQALTAHEHIDAVQVVIGAEDRAAYEEAVFGLQGLLPPVIGGATRQQSVLNGMEALVASRPRRVLIHDAARPFVSTAVIDRVIAACDDEAGAIPALPVNETVKRVHEGTISETVPRENLATAQTPQGFPFEPLLRAHREAAASGRTDITDDAAVAALGGIAVRVVDGDRANMKITTPADFATAEATLRIEMETRSAQGYDVHAFGDGQSVWLCGVEIPHHRGLRDIRTPMSVCTPSRTRCSAPSRTATSAGISRPPTRNGRARVPTGSLPTPCGVCASAVAASCTWTSR